MKIIKVSNKGKNKIELILEDNSSFILDREIIINNSLFKGKDIKKNDLEAKKAYNEDFSMALNYLKKKRTIKEIGEKLEDSDYREEIIKRLKELNYLDDLDYSLSYVNDRINLSNDGPSKIKSFLEEKGVEENNILNALSIFDGALEEERLNRLLEKELKTNKKSSLILKKKLYVRFLSLGYSSNIINKVTSNIFLDEDNLKELERKKLIKKYQAKYKNEELEKIVRQKLYEKGFK